MTPNYQPIDHDFHTELKRAVSQRRQVLLQYFSELQELRVESVRLDALLTQDDADYLRLTSGEEIRLDRIIRLDDLPSPTYAGYPDFSCGC